MHLSNLITNYIRDNLRSSLADTIDGLQYIFGLSLPQAIDQIREYVVNTGVKRHA